MFVCPGFGSDHVFLLSGGDGVGLFDEGGDVAECEVGGYGKRVRCAAEVDREI